MTAHNEITKQIMIMTYKLSVCDQIKDVQKLMKDFRKDNEIRKFIKSKQNKKELIIQV